MTTNLDTADGGSRPAVPPDIEREIAQLEEELAGVEDALGMPATWRDSVKARDIQLRHDDIKRELAQLYAHWEEALEFES